MFVLGLFVGAFVYLVGMVALAINQANKNRKLTDEINKRLLAEHAMANALRAAMHSDLVKLLDRTPYQKRRSGKAKEQTALPLEENNVC